MKSAINDVCSDLTAAVNGNQYVTGMLQQLAGQAFSGVDVMSIQRDFEGVLCSSAPTTAQARSDALKAAIHRLRAVSPRADI